MSDSDEDNYQFLGKLLEPYDEDAVPKKKAFNIEDQVATDEQGRRRFHGAFTGGFSAGFFNTVGSLEGWKPTEFKSSRSEKAEKKFQTPKDFMDDEDMGEFGIAPTVVRATSDYSNQVVNRKRIKHSEGPIPGVPVLHSILQPAKDTVGVKLLKKMGWKPGQGVGPRLTKRQKNQAKRENHANQGKVYGCVIPDEFRTPIQIDSESSDDMTEEFTFAPDDYDPFVYQPKDNSFGMGYQGLDKKKSIHISLFDPPEFRMQDFNNKKVSISGQAFGVGAFEHEDEDIYTRDDMSKYDFQLETSRKKKKVSPKKLENSKENILDGFTVAGNTVLPKKTFPPPVLPKNFIPKHGIRLSRFEPLPETHKYYNYDRTKTIGRHDMTASDRTKIFNAEERNSKTRKEFVQSTLKSAANEENQLLQEPTTSHGVSKPFITKTAISHGVFKPFITNPEKQKRYEDYLALNERDHLSDLQPTSMTDWEKQNERNEFEQASRLYKPVAGLVFDRFITASDQSDGLDLLKKVEKSVYQHGTEEMRQAAKLKMFGKLTRTVEVWVPSKLLCKRFNVPEPEVSEVDKIQTRKPKPKFSVFDYYEAHQQNKGGTEMEMKTNIMDIDKPVSKDLTEQPNINDTILASKTTMLQTESTKSSNSLTIPSTSNNITESKDDKECSNTSESTKTLKQPKITAPEPTPMPTDPKEKLDLFRAIFLSSSESEDEHEQKQNNGQDKISEMKQIVLKETSIKQNVIENQRVNKGIFADLDLRQMNQTESSPLKTAENEIVTPTGVNIYGPTLPVQISRDNKETVWKPSFHKVSLSQIESSSSEDEWMEKSSAKTNKKSSKKNKKHKSEAKSKHKKHKSKHKKKKHSDKH